LAAARGYRFITRKKEHTDGGVVLWSLPQALDFSSEERQWQLCEQTSSVTRSAVSIDCSAVGQIAKSLKRALDDAVRRASRNIGDESHSTRVVFIERVVQ
jgi:hypothetical protein